MEKLGGIKCRRPLYVYNGDVPTAAEIGAGRTTAIHFCYTEGYWYKDRTETNDLPD